MKTQSVSWALLYSSVRRSWDQVIFHRYISEKARITFAVCWKSSDYHVEYEYTRQSKKKKLTSQTTKQGEEQEHEGIRENEIEDNEIYA
jgi:hypothetical protein